MDFKARITSLWETPGIGVAFAANSAGTQRRLQIEGLQQWIANFQSACRPRYGELRMESPLQHEHLGGSQAVLNGGFVLP